MVVFCRGGCRYRCTGKIELQLHKRRTQASIYAVESAQQSYKREDISSNSWLILLVLQP
jgi:hypothetical protein